MATTDDRVERLERLLRDCPLTLDATTAGLLTDWLVERGVVALAPDESPDTPVGLNYPGFRLARPGEAVPTPEDYIAREREEVES